MSPIEPEFPPVTITAFITCRPATSFTPSCENGLRWSQPPVSGTVIGPVRSTPLNSRRNVPPGPLQATCMSMRYPWHGQVLEPREVLEERKISLADRPSLNWRSVPKDCGNGYGCFISLRMYFTGYDSRYPACAKPEPIRLRQQSCSRS